MGKVTTGRKIKPHDAVVGLEKASVNLKVSRGSRIRLDIDAPLIGVEAVSLKRAGLTKPLNLVNLLIPTVVAGTGEALSILVGEGGAKAIDHSLGGKVLGGNQLERTPLAILFTLNNVIQVGVVLRKGSQTGEWQILFVIGFVRLRCWVNVEIWRGSVRILLVHC